MTGRQAGHTRIHLKPSPHSRVVVLLHSSAEDCQHGHAAVLELELVWKGWYSDDDEDDDERGFT